MRLQPSPIRNGRDPPAHPLSGAPRPSLCSRMRDTFAPDPKTNAASTVWTISVPDENCPRQVGCAPLGASLWTYPRNTSRFALRRFSNLVCFRVCPECPAKPLPKAWKQPGSAGARAQKIDRGACGTRRADVHVDHGGLQPCVPHEILDFAHRHTRFQHVGGVTVAQEVRMNAPGHTGRLGCIAQSDSSHVGHRVPAAKLAGFWVTERTVGTEHMLPVPGSVGTCQFSSKCIRKIDAREPFLQIGFPQRTAPHKVLLQAFANRRRNW